MPTLVAIQYQPVLHQPGLRVLPSAGVTAVVIVLGTIPVGSKFLVRLTVEEHSKTTKLEIDWSKYQFLLCANSDIREQEPTAIKDT